MKELWHIEIRLREIEHSCDSGGNRKYWRESNRKQQNKGVKGEQMVNGLVRNKQVSLNVSLSKTGSFS